MKGIGMQVGLVSNISKIINPMVKTVSFSKLPDIPNDTFVRTTSPITEPQSNVDIALKTALEFCRQSVMQDKPVESQMTFDPTGKVLYQNIGDEKSCKLESDKLAWGSTAVHSHPKSCTLSDVDAMVLVSNPRLSKVVSVDANGRYCSLEKPDNYSTFLTKDEQRILFYQLNNKMTQIWQESLPKVDNPKEFCMQENERRLMEAYNFDDVDTMYREFGHSRTGNPDTDMGNIGWRFYMQEAMSKNIKPVSLDDAEWSVTKIQIEQLDGTDKAIEIGKKVNQAYADILGLKYSYSDSI